MAGFKPQKRGGAAVGEETSGNLETGRSVSDYQKAKAALLAKVNPSNYGQLSDAQDQVAFVLAICGKNGPDIPGYASKLSWSDFMGAAQFNQYATLVYYPLTNTFGSYSRGATAVPIPTFNALLVQAGFVDNAAHGGHGTHH